MGRPWRGGGGGGARVYCSRGAGAGGRRPRGEGTGGEGRARAGGVGFWWALFWGGRREDLEVEEAPSWRATAAANQGEGGAEREREREVSVPFAGWVSTSRRVSSLSCYSRSVPLQFSGLVG